MALLPITALVTLLHGLLALRLLPALAERTPAWPLLAGLLVVSASSMPLPFLSSRRHWRVPAWLKWIGLLSMGWFSSLFVLSVLRDLLLLGQWLVSVASGGALNDNWRTTSALVVPLLATLVTLVGFFNARW